jgi:hypothetical protein
MSARRARRDALRVALALGLLAAAPGMAGAQGQPPRPGPPAEPPLVRPAPIGEAGPATAAGTTGLDVRAGLEVFAQYGIRVTDTRGDSDWFHLFEVPRAHGALTADYDTVRARVVVEAVRSASEGALIGVAGDSLVLRLREAYAGWRPWPWLSGSFGVVPTLTVPELDATFRMRAVAATPLEATGLASPADLGATVRAELPRGYGWVGVGGYNGEGYNGRELNRGKNLEAAAEVHPLPLGAARPLAVFASYVAGSTGTGRARADRLTGALLWQGDWLRAGVAATYAWGVEDAGGVRSVLGDVFVHTEPYPRLLLGVRGSLWLRNTDADDDQVIQVTGAVGYRVAVPLEVFLATTRSLPAELAQDALPGSDFWDFRLVSRVVF